MNILIVSDYFRPGFKSGGPIKVIEAWLRLLAPEHQIFIVTQRKDWGEPQVYANIEPNQWINQEFAQVIYFDRSFKDVFKINSIILDKKIDCVLLNSFFSPWSRNYILFNYFMSWKRPKITTFIVPHGEFSESALDIKAIRKKLYLSLSRVLNLYRGIRFISLSRFESETFRQNVRWLIGNYFETAPLLSDKSEVDANQAGAKKSGVLKAVFLSRISPMKNLHFLLEITRNLKASMSLDIWGPVDSGHQQYWQKCQELISDQPENIKITYRGVCPTGQVGKILPEYDLFILPTLGENFGFVVWEALDANVPIMLSDRTDWNRLQENGPGWFLSLNDKNAWIETLTKAIQMNANDWQKLKEKVTTARRQVLLENDQAGVEFKKLFSL